MTDTFKPGDITLATKIHDDRPEGERGVEATIKLDGEEIGQAFLTITDDGEDLDCTFDRLVLTDFEIDNDDYERFEDDARHIVRDSLWEEGDRAGLTEPLKTYAVQVAAYVRVAARNTDHAKEQVATMIHDKNVYLDVDADLMVSPLEVEQATEEIV
jgi:hypothetical protein